MRSGLTDRERACLAFLDDKMHASPEQIGAAVQPDGGKSKRGNVTIGHRVADGLWRHVPALVTYLGRAVGYRITPAGRSALAEEDGQDG